MRKAVLIRKHLEENKQDMPGKRGLQLTESKINRLAKYYKETGKLDTAWKYDPERIKLQVE
jgi:small subunit ribosomal protein S15